MAIKFNPFTGNFDITGGSVPGPQGPTGPQGPQGDAGVTFGNIDGGSSVTAAVTNYIIDGGGA